MANKTFSVKIRDAKTKQEYTSNNFNQVGIPHNTKYELMIWNSNSVPADLQIKIDGKVVWEALRINAYQTIYVDRPSSEAKVFTAVHPDSKQGISSGIKNVASSNLGLIEVTCTPGKAPFNVEAIKERSVTAYNVQGSYINTGDGNIHIGDSYKNYRGSLDGYGSMGRVAKASYDVSLNSRSAAGTGLSGKSNSVVTTARKIELDNSKVEILRVRLMVEEEDTEVYELNPRVVYEDAVPPTY